MVYADPSVTDIACQGLNGLKMGDRVLTVRRATEVKSYGLIFRTRLIVTEDHSNVSFREEKNRCFVALMD